MPYDWNNPYDSPVPYDVGNPQILPPLLGIASAQAFGILGINAPVTVTLAGIASSQSFGATTVQAPSSFTLTGIPSSESFGALTVKSPSILNLTGIPSSESFGALSLTEGVATAVPKLVQKTSNFGISGSVASITFTTLNITSGNFIVVMGAITLPTSILSVTDTAGNVYSNAITNINSGLSCVTIWYAPITSGGGTKPTVHISTGGSGLVYAFLYEFSQINNASPVDVPAVASVSGSTGVNVSSGSLLTSYPHDLLVGICACASTVTGVETGWSGTAGASNADIEAITFITPVQGAYASTFTQTSPGNYNAALASFAPQQFGPVRMARIL